MIIEVRHGFYICAILQVHTLLFVLLLTLSLCFRITSLWILLVVLAVRQPHNGPCFLLTAQLLVLFTPLAQLEIAKPLRTTMIVNQGSAIDEA